MADQVAYLAAAIPGMAASVLSDLQPLLVLGLGLAFAGAIVAFIRSMV